MKKVNCEFCGKFIDNPGSLKSHENCCLINPNRIPRLSNFVKWNKERKKLGIKGSNQFTKAKKLGLPKPIVSEETRKKISDAAKQQIWTVERRELQSKYMKIAVQKHPESYSAKNVCGRNKQVEYNGIKLNSTWELTVVNWLEENGICWERNTTGFQYYWEEKQSIHTYFPDFYLPEYDRFVEVKGYETERDRCKWKVVDNLIILKNKDIQNIKNSCVSPHAYIMSKG